jgi:hypothetical protein
MAKSICDECGAERVKLTGASRYVGCPNGHGRLYLPPDPDPPAPPRPRGRPRTVTLEARLVDPCVLPYRYSIVGLDGPFRKYAHWAVGPWNKQRQRETPGEIVRARLNGKSVKFVIIVEDAT